jgi:hypothetical protein
MSVPPAGPQLEERLRALELQIEDLNRSRRRRRIVTPRPVSRLLTALAVIAAVGILPMVVLASDTFTDVPDSNTFHDSINNLYNAGIANGCQSTPTLKYCPGSAVTRGQMAAFLNRGLGRAASGQGGVTALADINETDLATVTIDTGGVSGGTGFVLVTGSVSAATLSSTTCPCEVSVAVRNVTDDEAIGSLRFEVLNIESPSGNRSGSGGNTWVFAVDSGSSREFSVQASLDMTGATGNVQVEGRVSAVYVPFGATGGSALGE